jgi:hypothetical protein
MGSLIKQDYSFNGNFNKLKEKYNNIETGYLWSIKEHPEYGRVIGSVGIEYLYNTSNIVSVVPFKKTNYGI